MSNITVNSDSLAKRCEICHQSDCFDPYTNECSRCASSKSSIKELSTKKINVLVERTLKDELGLSYKSFASAWAYMIGFYGLFMMGIQMLFSYRHENHFSHAFTFNMFLIGLGYFIFLVALVFWVRYKAFKNKEKSIRFCFEENTYEASTEKVFTRVSWDSLQKVSETRTDFWLYQELNVYHVVPKKFFTSLEDIEKLRIIIKSKLGSKAKIFSGKRSLFYHPAISATVFLMGVSCLLFLAFTSYKHSQKENLHAQASEMFSFFSSEEDYEKGKATLLDLEKQYPDDELIKNSLGDGFFCKEAYSEAQKYYLEAIKDPERYGSHELSHIKNRIGICCLEQNNLEQAKTHFLDSLTIRPSNWMAAKYLGDIELKKDNHEVAEQYYLRAIAISPEGTDSRFSLARFYKLKSRIPEAITQYELIEKLAKDDYPELVELAIKERLELENNSE
jgi:tetratricopeptide (TPR) repeat protein